MYVFRSNLASKVHNYREKQLKTSYKSEKGRSCNGSSESGWIALIRRVGAIFIGRRARKLIHPRIRADYRLFAPTG